MDVPIKFHDQERLYLHELVILLSEILDGGSPEFEQSFGDFICEKLEWTGWVNSTEQELEKIVLGVCAPDLRDWPAGMDDTLPNRLKRYYKGQIDWYRGQSGNSDFWFGKCNPALANACVTVRSSSDQYKVNRHYCLDVLLADRYAHYMFQEVSKIATGAFAQNGLRIKEFESGAKQIVGDTTGYFGVKPYLQADFLTSAEVEELNIDGIEAWPVRISVGLLITHDR